MSLFVLALIFAIIHSLLNPPPLANALEPAENENKRTRLFRLYSNRGTLDRWANGGTFVQFDGPMRIGSELAQGSTVSVTLAEPFFLRPFFRIVPIAASNSTVSSSPIGGSSSASTVLLRPGQAFKLALTRDTSELPVKHWDNDGSTTLNITLMAQVMTSSPADAVNAISENFSHFSVHPIEEQHIVVQMISSKKSWPNVPGDPSRKFVTVAFQAVRDPNNCSIFRAKVKNWPQQLFPIRLIGAGAEQFSLIVPPSFNSNNASGTTKASTTDDAEANNLLILRQQNATNVGAKECSLESTVSPLSFLLYMDLSEIYGMPKYVLHPIQLFTSLNNTNNALNAPRFARARFNVQYNATARAFAPPLVLLAHVVHPSSPPAQRDDDRDVEFGLAQDAAGAAELVEMAPATGIIVPRDDHALAAALRRRFALSLTATLRHRRADRRVADKAEIRIELAPEKNGTTEQQQQTETGGTGEAAKSDGDGAAETVRFAKPIYAFAIDPLRNQLASDGIATVGTVDTTPTQMPVLLRHRLNNSLIDRIDTAIVHVLVAAPSSQPARFPHAFAVRRVPMPSSHFPATAVPKSVLNILLPTAHDPDLDARLSYTIEKVGSACRDHFGALMNAERCMRAFSVSQRDSSDDDDASSSATSALVVNVDQAAAQPMSEAVLNISVHDAAHAAEPRYYTILLVKFVAENASSASESTAAEPFSLKKAIADANFPAQITLNDSLPANALVHSFGLALPRSPALSFVLFTNLRHFAIGKDSGKI
ncbi:hypothetical protein niasHT_025462 [Heterodera trifolii]|uniref:Uncharacterized protein n=1 Tax=Heterodera trifolii TaxID=157864 RepID=A0ABD2JXM8_9BILA